MSKSTLPADITEIATARSETDTTIYDLQEINENVMLEVAVRFGEENDGDICVVVLSANFGTGQSREIQIDIGPWGLAAFHAALRDAMKVLAGHRAWVRRTFVVGLPDEKLTVQVVESTTHTRTRWRSGSAVP